MRIRCIFLLPLLLIPFVSPAQTTAVAPAGSGTIGDPYVISTLGNLSYVAQNLGATDYWASGLHFIQTANIDASQTQYWDDVDTNLDGDLFNDLNDGTATGNNDGFMPIGNSTTKFKGSYDGQGYAISGLTISRSATSDVGLFGWVESHSSVIQDIHLVGGSITGNSQTGALAGRFWYGDVIGCSSSADVTGGANVGGLIGQIVSPAQIFDSYTSGNVQASSQAGGLVGLNQASGAGIGILRCYATGNVTTSSAKAGGLVGYNLGTIENSYARGNVSGSNEAGGLVGIEGGTWSVVMNSYSTGSVTCPGASKGGMVGNMAAAGTYTNNFWDTQTSGQATSSGATGKTTAEMKTESTFTAASWDFMDETTNGVNDYWGLNPWENDGYPFLNWQGFSNGGTFPAHGGYALDFDGTDDLVIRTNPADLAIFGDLTLEVWAKYDQLAAGDNTLICKGSGAAGDTEPDNVLYILRIKDTKHLSFFWEYGAGVNQGANSTVTANINAGEWHHYVMVRNATANTVTFYVDGVQLGSAIAYTSEPTGGTTAPFVIGSEYNNTTSAGYSFWNGQIDEVRVWDDVRTQAEIQAHMHKELAGDEANLAAYYAMTNGSGTSLADNSGNGNTGTLTNGPTWKTSGAHAGPRMALDFDGADDYVSVPDDNDLDLTNTFTIEGWINPDAFAGGTYGRIVSKSNAYGLGFSGSVFRFTTYNVKDYDLSYSLPTGTWSHIAIAMDAGNDVTFYVNGRNVGTINGNSPANTNTQPLLIGGSTYSAIEDFDGKIDEVRIWSAVRTEAEVLANMYRTLDGDEDGLVAYYRFDQQANAGNTTAYDLSANAHHGTLTNMDPATDWIASTPFNTWIGSEDSDWNNAANWGSGTVPATEDVGIYAWSGSNPPASANISGRNFYLDAGVSLSHSGNLTLSGDYYNAGTFVTTGNVTFSGSANQRIRGTGASTFGTLTINNAAGVTMQQDVTTTTSLTLTNGALSIGANTLTINGAISQAFGSLTGGASSNLVIGGSGASTALPAITLNHLTLNRPNGISLDGTLDLGGVLTLSSGVIDLAANSLILRSAASVAGAPGVASHVDASSGVVRKDYSGIGSFAFPVGDGAMYSPITLNFTAGTFNTGYALVSLSSAKHPNNASTTDFLTRYWTVNSSGITAFSCDVSAQYANGDVQGTEANLTGAKYSGGNWVDLGPVNQGSNLITGTVTEFSDFTAGEPAAFPVEWLGFEATAQQGQVLLDWQTASEQNSHYFAVERSSDGLGWATLGQVSAAGHSDVTRSYQFLDSKPLSGLQYYRLRQVDFDGRHGYSDVRSVNLEATLSVYPNPVRDLLYLDLSGDWSFELADIHGRVLAQQRGRDRGSISLVTLPAGVYVLQVKGSSHSSKILIRKE